MSKDKEKEKEKDDRRLPPCTLAPEWAEHARPWDHDVEPCDDGRGAHVCGSREGEEECER